MVVNRKTTEQKKKGRSKRRSPALLHDKITRCRAGRQKERNTVTEGRGEKEEGHWKTRTMKQ
jgi:hypothetical protein